MKDTNREKHIQVRFTEPEIVKFKQVAKENGLTLSGFARYSMARTSIILREIKKSCNGKYNIENIQKVETRTSSNCTSKRNGFK
ncbi:hypothetical protein N8151_01050 [Flavobacteriaceae bacterium]|nr:hypothetical protein [Flavobacteriaceae bacterium]